MVAPQHIILADIDNTLYDWPAFFAPSFRAMCHAVSKKLNLPLETLFSDFKGVYAKHDSLEYAFSIQELKAVRSLDENSINDLIKAGRGAFSRVQRFHLKPYEGVVEGLAYLADQGHLVYCVTNSPIYLAQKRLYQLGLDKYICGLVAWEGISPPKNVNKQFVTLGPRQRTRVKDIKTFTKSDSKPQTKPYKLALELSQESGAQTVWAIGDSLNKDLEPASRLGITTVWAKYGNVSDFETKDQQTLMKITNWSSEDVNFSHNEVKFKPDFEVNSFAEFSALLPKRNFDLFDYLDDI